MESDKELLKDITDVEKYISTENSHHKWEQGIIQLLNLDGWNLEWTGEEYSHYDAKGFTPKGFRCVMEIKLRHSYYPTKILEEYKYNKLMKEDALKFYYVFDTKGNYLYYLDGLGLPELVTIQSKTKHKFDDDTIIDKKVFMLSESQASIVNKY